MPEGDTLLRSAARLHQWLGGRVVTGASSSKIDASRLVGRTIELVEARGKHLLIRCTLDGRGPLIVRSHLRMTGSWHVYAAHDRWRRPEHRARLVVRAGDRLGVCFDAPTIDLFTEGDLERSSVARLGPDVLTDVFDPANVRARLLARPGRGARLALGELLLDQELVAGVGNIYRCEALFAERLHPWTAAGSVDPAALDALLWRCATLMRANVVGSDAQRGFGRAPGKTWVYRRSGRPCLRCNTLIQSRPQGPMARTAYWCPTCQPGPAPS